MMKTEYTENGGFLQRDSVEYEEYADEGYRYAVCLDLSKYFDLLTKIKVINTISKIISKYAKYLVSVKP